MLLTFQGAHAADLVVKNAWVRLSPPVVNNSAAYMVVQNPSTENVKLIGVSCDAAASAGIHTMHMDGNRMVMHPENEVDIPAKGEAQFKPGGSHVMLMGLKHPLKEGEIVKIVFHLSNNESLTVSAPVRDMRMNHGHHGGMH